MSNSMNYRESAFIIVFESLFQKTELCELFENASEIENISLNSKTRKLVESVFENKDELEEKISSFSPKRTYSRIPKLNAAILLTVFAEILYVKNSPVNVSASEFMKLAATYGLDNDIKFVNGVLGSFTRSL